ncbi:MAG: ACP S-malonyltransferase [Burkholderiales bacterium]
MKLAFVFPGQGAQSVGMMQPYAELPQIEQTFRQASQVLKQDLWALVRDGDTEMLNLTVNTQPVMLTASIAIYRAWEALGGAQPSILAGHSFGELSAMVVSGAIAFEDALPLVRFRAEAMQQAVAETSGSMAVVLGLSDDGVRELCIDAAEDEVLEAVNYNAPGQVVIAGHRGAVVRGMERAKARGAKRALSLAVSVPAHCSLMRPAAAALDRYLEGVEINQPRIPVLHNSTLSCHPSAPEIKDALARQLHSPVRWAETVQHFVAQGIDTVIECGPGKVLTGLNKRIAEQLQLQCLSDVETIRAWAEKSKTE